MHGAYIVFGIGVASLLLSLVVWRDAHRTKQWAQHVVEWQEQQQRTVEQGGMVISVEVNPQPAQDRLHVLTTQIVRARRQMQREGSPNLN